MNKSALRKTYKKKRATLEAQGRKDASKDVAHRLLDKWKFEDEVVSVFLPIQKLFELDTHLIIRELSDKNIICSPVSDFSTHLMEHIELNDSSKIKENQWGIPEPLNGKSISPNEISVVLIPLLISDVKGHRLGYGKGFYDRFLNECKPKTLFIGLNYFDPIDKIPDINEFDIPLDYLVTPNQIYKSE